MKKKYLVLALSIGLTLGYLGGLVQVPHAHLENCSEETGKLGQFENEFARAREKFATISDVDIQEYFRLKDMKTRYEKADEILGKIMLVFIADLGLRIDRKQLMDTTKADGPANEQTQESRTRAEEMKSAPIGISQDNSSLQKALSEWKALDKKLDSIESDKEIDDFLDRSRVTNLSDLFTSFKPIRKMEGQLLEFLGQFTGETKLYVEDHRSLPTAVDFAMDGDRIRFNISIHDDTMFKTEFSGSAKAEGFFETVGDGNRAVFIGLDYYASKYLQLYYLPAKRMLVGTFYKKWERPGDIRSLGAVKLNKR